MKFVKLTQLTVKGEQCGEIYLNLERAEEIKEVDLLKRCNFAKDREGKPPIPATMITFCASEEGGNMAFVLETPIQILGTMPYYGD